MALQKVFYESGKTIITAENLNNIQDAILELEERKIPESTSDLTNDSGFITKTVNDLANYFLKSETYSRDEINQKVSAIPKFAIQVVGSLPTTGISETTVYLLKTGDDSDNLYTEYIYVNGAWEYLGKQAVDLTGYALKTDIPTKLSALTNDVGFITNTVSNLVNYYNKTEVDAKISQLSEDKVDKARVNKNGLDYGVVGDGSTDDSDAINALLASGWTTVYLPKKTYKITKPIALSGRHTEFICDGTINYTGEDAAIQILYNNSSIDVYQITASNGTAIKLDSTAHKVYGINVKCKFISAKVGLYLYANAKEVNYGVYNIDTLTATDIPVKIESVGSAILIHEHKFNIVSIKGESSALYGIYLYGTNCCRFLSGGIENLNSKAISLYVENSEYNTFENFRLMENYGAKRIKLVGYNRANEFGLSYCNLEEVDISELTNADNRTRYNRIRGQISLWGDYHIGNLVEISSEYGFLYDTSVNNGDSPNTVSLSEAPYMDKVIKQLANNEIPSYFICDGESLDLTTWTLSGLYNFGMLSGGNPLTFKFGSANGKIILKDNLGQTIIDNSDGKYLGKTVVILAIGIDDSEKNIWDKRVLNETYLTLETLPRYGGEFA